MGKDPAFLFYPNDWLGGTLGMTFEEKGAYFELLMLQFNRGHMTIHMITQAVGELWGNLEEKFIIDENGKYYNRRLDEEIKNRKKYCSSRRNNKKGNNQYTKGGHMTTHTGGHMENENRDENININTNKEGGSGWGFKPPTIDEIDTYCTKYKYTNVVPQQFVDFYTSKGWMIGKNHMKDWKAAVRSWESRSGIEQKPQRERQKFERLIGSYDHLAIDPFADSEPT